MWQSIGSRPKLATAFVAGSLIAVLTVLITPRALAAYNANIVGVPVIVSTYDNGTVLFSLNTQPSSHPLCNSDQFAIDPTLDPHIISRMYARLLSAQATGEAINIGYDNAGNCTSGFIHVHEIG